MLSLEFALIITVSLQGYYTMLDPANTKITRTPFPFCNPLHACIVKTVNDTYQTLSMKGIETCQN